MLERHYSHLEVLHRAEALAGKTYPAQKRVRPETTIIELGSGSSNIQNESEPRERELPVGVLCTNEQS
jgi:hypothetical protein